MLLRADVQRVICDPLLKHIMTERDKTKYYLATTSGTTGRKPMLVPGSTDIRDEWTGGKKRRLGCFGVRALRLKYTVMLMRDAKSSGSRALYPDQDDLRPGFGELVRDFMPEIGQGGNSYFTRVISHLPDEACGKIEDVSSGAETMTDERFQYLRKRLPSVRVRQVYNIGEMFTALTLARCPFIAPNTYHPERDVAIEIDQPDAEGFGDILISRTLPGNIRVDRYLSGDVGRFLPACKCGEKVTFQVAGRRGFDYLKLGPMLLVRQETDRVFALLGEFVDDYRVHAWEDRNGDRFKRNILFKVYKKGVSPDESLKRSILKHLHENLFVTQTHTLGDMVNAGELAVPDLIFSREAFPVIGKDIKISERPAV